MNAGRRCFLAGVLSVCVPALGGAQPATTRVSVASGGVQGNYGGWVSAMSADGRFVAFEGGGSNLVPGDTNFAVDIFLHDRLNAITTRVSVASNGTQATPYSSGSFMPAISADGRFVAFQSWAGNLVAGDTNGYPDIFVHDTLLFETTRVSVSSAGVQANHSSYSPSISADGRWVAFGSGASNLVPGASGGQVFVHDRQTGATTLVSATPAGVAAGPINGSPSISADGRWVAFDSYASDLVPGDTNDTYDVFLRDLLAGTTTRVSVAPGGAEASRGGSSPAISADGRWVAFESGSGDLLPGGTIGIEVFVHDRLTGMTTLVSQGPGGAQGNLNSYSPALSADGRWIAFRSDATNLVDGDTNAAMDVFVHDRLTLTTTRVSVGLGDVQGNGASGHPSAFPPDISDDGRWVSFESQASNLVAGDTNNDWDVFVRDRGDLTCVTIAPASISVPAAGATGQVTVTAPASCTWAAVANNPSWLGVTGGGSGPGNGTLSYSVAVNTGGARTGTIAIGGEVFTVNQSSGDPTPAAPLGLVAHLIAANAVTLRWTVDPGSFPPTGFVIEGGLTPGSVQASLPTGSATPTFTFQAPPGSFYVRVHAVNGAFRSPPSNEIRIHVLVPVVPSAPANLLGLVNGSTLALAWSNTYGGGAPASLVLDVAGAITTSVPLNLVNAFIFFGVPDGTYTLRLRALNAAGSSAASNAVTLTFPLPCTGPPLPPSNFLAYNVGRALFIDWAPAASGPAPTSYVLNVTGALVATIPIGGRFTSGVVAPGTYALNVAAINPCGTSATTAVRTIVVP